MKYFYTFLLLLNICSCQIPTVSEIKNQLIKTNFDNEKKYPLKTLGYITPWNKEGYEYVEKYTKKFDIVSPTWFELKSDELDGEFQIILDGSNNIDSAYMKRIKKNNPNLLILPRLHAGFNDQTFYKLWFQKSVDQFIKVLERRIKYNKFDGYVFDCIYLWFNENLLNQFTNQLLPKMGKLMKKLNKTLIMTIVPYFPQNVINKETFKKIATYVDYFNIMTYDYGQYRISIDKFLSPISWIKDTINYYVDAADKDKTELLKKILLGIPYYGYAYDGRNNNQEGSVTGKQFMNIFHQKEKNLKINYDKNQEEYHFDTGDGKMISFPLNNFLNKRLELTKNLNLGGCGIWEIGNGLEEFLELL